MRAGRIPLSCCTAPPARGSSLRVQEEWSSPWAAPWGQGLPGLGRAGGRMEGRKGMPLEGSTVQAGLHSG